ncbi:MAG: CueP family metal-binding protein [Candidatus Izimaplasma sp.]|nr:CueP family metal-binding protein [Candidatus Izimaplasma bacterium]
MKKLFILLFLVGITIVLTACQPASDLESLGLANLTAKEILTQVENDTLDVDGFALSVYDDELLVITEDDRLSIPLPEDEFYLSVAPFINTTHECFYHSATGCRGELKNASFDVKYVASDGEVLYEATHNSQSNGFIDMWLPRNQEGTLTINYNDQTASKTITTYAEDPTCETTMQLS